MMMMMMMMMMTRRRRRRKTARVSTVWVSMVEAAVCSFRLVRHLHLLYPAVRRLHRPRYTCGEMMRDCCPH
jgi:hypothetical protein